MRHVLFRLLLVSLALLLAACGAASDETTTPTDVPATATPRPAQAASTPTSPNATATTAPTSTPEPTATATATPAPTNTPTPTATPEPTATPQPTSTPTPIPPTPTATPLPEPRVYSGFGDDVISIEKPAGPDSVAIAYIRGNAASAHFAVESFDDAGEQLDLLVNTIDPYEGIVLLDIRQGDRTTRLQVSAEGEWHIEIRPLATARRVSIPGTIEGAGDDVFIVEGDPDIAHISGNEGAQHFAVIAYGSRSHLLVNTIDPYDGRVIVAADVVLFEVDAESPWMISFE